MAFSLLHLSDLHLGQRFHDRGRADDEQHALEQVLELVREREVDVVAISGDVFDIAHPAAADLERFHQFVSRLMLEAGAGSVVAIAGNHDSPARIEGPRDLLARVRLHMRGAWRREDPPELCHADLYSRAGEHVGRALAIPFLREGDVRHRAAGETVAEAAAAHVVALEERLAAAHESLPRDLPFVVVAHAFATGGSFGGGERPIQVGNEARVPAAAFAGDAAYLALGHLHRPQAVSGREHWRYSGSLLPTGFDELDVPRQVVLARVPDAGPAAIETVPLTPYRRYVRLSGPPPRLESKIAELPEPDPREPEPWLRARVELNAPWPGLAQRLADVAQERGWQLLGVECRFVSTTGEEESDEEAPPPLLDLEDSEAVFTELLEKRQIEEESRPRLLAGFRFVSEHMDELLPEAEG